MSKTPSPYYIETECGKLELMKGTYLTMLKRKELGKNTVVKSKQIRHQVNKKTVKRQATKSYGRKVIQIKNSIIMKDKLNKNHIFPVHQDENLFNTQFSLPSIHMEYDNDDDSQWHQIDETVRNMALSLSVAIYDRTYQRSE